MKKQALINGIGAVLYITLVSLLMNYSNGPDLPEKYFVLVPIAMLSLLTISVIAMGYFFFYHPVMLYLDKKKKDAINLFLQTVLVFGSITVVLLVVALFGILG